MSKGDERGEIAVRSGSPKKLFNKTKTWEEGDSCSEKKTNTTVTVLPP